MKARLPLLAGIAAILAIIPVFVWWRVCDEQLSSAGRAVEVCRHMTVTDPPVVALGMLALVMFSGFYAEISGFGFTLRRKIEELGESVSDLTEFNEKRLAQRSAGQEFESTAVGRVPDARIAGLAERYDHLRVTMPSGSARTRRMTELFKQMQDALRDEPDFDLVGHLAHQDRGVRLAAYAYLREHVEPDMMADLVDAAADEDRPFGQYAALRAALHQRDNGVPLSDDDRARLRDLRGRAGSRTDRTRLVTDLLDEG